MTAIHIDAKLEEYFLINKNILLNPNLSWKEKGIITYLLSLPNKKIVKLSDLRMFSRDGDRSIKSGLKNLESMGYMTELMKNGKSIDYVVSNFLPKISVK